MALILDATVGGPSSNTYITLAEAEIYFESRLNSANWTAANDATKNQALAHATALLDREPFDGVKASSSQNLKFPRSGLVEDGGAVSTSIVPGCVKAAVCELALVLLGSDIQEHSELSKFKRLKVDVIDIEANSDISNSLPDSVMKAIAPFQTSVGQGNLLR